MLTDVVVEVTVTALLLALAVQAHERTGKLDPNDLGILRDKIGVLTPPLPVALPLLIAALLAALNHRAPRWFANGLAILTSLTVCCVAISMLVYTRDDTIVVYWFGGWVPRGNTPFGIGFVIDQAGAMLVLLSGILVTAGLIFSSRYFDTVGTLYHALMLIFLGSGQRLQPDGRPLQPVRVFRADEYRRVCALRLQVGGAGTAPGRA